MSTPEDWPDIARMSRDVLAEECAALRRALTAQRDECAALAEWRCPSCGAVTRARMADSAASTAPVDRA